MSQSCWSRSKLHNIPSIEPPGPVLQFRECLLRCEIWDRLTGSFSQQWGPAQCPAGNMQSPGQRGQLGSERAQSSPWPAPATTGTVRMEAPGLCRMPCHLQRAPIRAQSSSSAITGWGRRSALDPLARCCHAAFLAYICPALPGIASACTPSNSLYFVVDDAAPSLPACR